MQSILLDHYPLNNKLTLKNRVLMSPMTRVFATEQGVPTAEMADYYARRAEAGLIITEGTIIQPEARGYDKVPGIYDEAQIAGWKKVTEAVHANGGNIFLQIWHVGRVSHPRFQDGQLPISASATEMTGKIPRSEGLSYGWSRAATLEEITALIARYATAANNALRAGFDGVEIHGANGYLIDQFLHYHTNQRADIYGGSPENMARFALAIVQACGEAIGYERVGLRLSPGAYLNEIKGDLRDGEVFAYLLKQLNQFPLAYVHTGNFDDTQTFPELANKTMTQFIRTHYQGTVVAAGSYSFEKAQQAITADAFDLVAIGRPFIANPDLITRYRTGAALTDYDRSMLDRLY